MKRMKISKDDGVTGIPSKNDTPSSKMHGQANYMHPISGFDDDESYPADIRSRDTGKPGIKKVYIFTFILVIAMALVIAIIFFAKGMTQTSEADKLRKFLETEDSNGIKNGERISEVYDPHNTKSWSGVEWSGNQVTSIDWGTPSPAPSPRSPSLIDIKGCDERVVAPDNDSWLPEYMTKHVKSQNGNCLILRLGPVEYYEDGGDNYLDRVWEKTEVTELARQNGFSLIKTATGQVGWVKSHLIVSENVVGDISWNYNETTKTLTVSGSGSMDIGFSNLTLGDKFEKLVITDGVTSICDSAFKGNDKLREVYLPESLVDINDYAFSDCSNITEIHLPSGLKSLGVGAFQGCSSLRKINLPKGLTGPEWMSQPGTDRTPGIAFNLFARCSSLKSIEIPSDAECIGQSAFVDCRGLTEITIPDGVMTIGIYTFKDCAGLTELYIPASVNWIDCGAFEGCSNLRTVYLAGNVETFIHPFDECPNLKDIYFGGTQEQWNEMQEYCHDDWLSGVTVHFDSM